MTLIQPLRRVEKYKEVTRAFLVLSCGHEIATKYGIKRVPSRKRCTVCHARPLREPR